MDRDIKHLKEDHPLQDRDLRDPMEVLVRDPKEGHHLLVRGLKVPKVDLRHLVIKDPMEIQEVSHWDRDIKPLKDDLHLRVRDLNKDLKADHPRLARDLKDSKVVQEL